ncbi:hypothetical protein IMSHALPRED_004094 [Imshaugia aleurites]|uniref:Uncharacterized protein n=1 Tax=Imshaugia aleurites TaxID=172621 RepID=A0A8H3EI49_9LECA|nr:hypothetical protein IMSHALPRED_004094 [Imshaugia aleurites]
MDGVKDQASLEVRPHEDLLPHQVDNHQTSHIRAQFSNLSLVEANETVIAEDGHPSSLSANPHASTEDSTPLNTIYVIRTPTALQNFLTTQPSACIKTIRLVLLYPLESILLTLEEQMGSSGPNVTPVFAAWMQAFKLIPPTIQLIQVDISHSFVLRTLMLGKLTQHLSTTVYLRSERKARFEVVGAKTDAGKAFIEAGMVG